MGHQPGQNRRIDAAGQFLVYRNHTAVGSYTSTSEIDDWAHLAPHYVEQVIYDCGAS